MAGRHLGSTLSLLRQGATLGAEFGLHSVEALLWVGETVEESVYARGSLALTATGLVFTLSNPPLRLGAFGSVRVWRDGVEAAPAAVRIRSPTSAPWRAAAEVTRDAPVELLPGVPVEVAIDGATAVAADQEIRIRLELRSVAIPPTVWFEFSDVPKTESSP